MLRGIIIWGIWIAVAAALAAPQSVYGDVAPSLHGDVLSELADTPQDPVIEEPIRPLFPNGVDAVPSARACGSSDVLMMSSFAGLLLMLNAASNGRTRRGA